MQGMLNSRPSQQQMQQLQKFGKAHSLVMQADAQRQRNPPDLRAAAALYKQAAELGSLGAVQLRADDSAEGG